jgi:hypothetical protein
VTEREELKKHQVINISFVAKILPYTHSAAWIAAPESIIVKLKCVRYFTTDHAIPPPPKYEATAKQKERQHKKLRRLKRTIKSTFRDF